MNNKLIVTAAPHITSADSTQKIMGKVCLALVPTLIASIFIFGVGSLVVTAVTVAACVFFEWAYCKLMGREIPIADFSAVVTGLLLAFNMPATLPWWMAIVGAFIAIVIIKQLFGGLGYNFANPAIVGRIALAVGFGAKMAAYPLPDNGVDALTSATPLAGKLHPPPRQTGQLVPQLGKLHLELTLGAHRPLGKDIQNQHSAVDDRAVQLLLQVADLEGGKLVVKDYRVRPAVSDKLRQLLQPSRPQAGGGVRLRPLLGEDAGALISGGGRQLPQLLHGSVHIVCTGVHPRQHGQGGVLGVVFVHDPGSFPVGFWGLPQPLFLP